MKIVFLCGSLEPGKDGVGDYTRRLTGEMMKQGVKVAIVALSDPYLSIDMEGTQFTDGIYVEVLRIPSCWSHAKRFKRAKAWIAILNPEWLSLQFVLFAFHPKGIPFRLSSWLKWLGKDRHWQIMFHELWVGMDIHSSKMLFCWGLIQKKIIRSLILKLRPCVIHTQTRLYQAQLAKIRFRTEYLPLFTNIRILTPSVNSLALIQNRIDKIGSITMVLFGVMHANTPVDQLSKEVYFFSKKYDIFIQLLIIGRSGRAEQTRWQNAFIQVGLQVQLLGEQPASKISEILSKASIGIATTAFALIDKSGSVAAMRAHGLPVLCVSPPWTPSGIHSFNPAPGILEYSIGNFEVCMTGKIDMPVSYSVTDIAATMNDSLTRSSH